MQPDRGPDWEDDDEVLAQLRDALREERDVPPEVVEASKGLFTWRSIDAELAALTYDSQTVQAATRTEHASIRDLTFATPDLVIQVQLTGTSVQGQVVPPQPGELELHVEGRRPVVVAIDEDGWFSVDHRAGVPFRLVCRTAGGVRAMTDWVTA